MTSIRQRRERKVESNSPINSGTARNYSNSLSSSTIKSGNNDLIAVDVDNDGRNNNRISYYKSQRNLNMIPDKNYGNFVSGKSFEQKAGSFINGHACANICIGFSFVGMIFMLFIGIITSTQPIYIQGIQPKEGIDGVTYNVTTENQKLPATKHAYQACFAYFVTILLCKAYQHNYFSNCYARIRMLRRFQYTSIPDHSNTNLRHKLPTYFPSQKLQNNNKKLVDVWNRFIVWIQNNITRYSARSKRRRE